MNWLDPNLLWVLFGTMFLGIAAGALGSFSFLRGRSLMGDALAHAALPGVCIAFLVSEWLRSRGVLEGSGAKNLGVILLGAGIAGVIAAWCVAQITRHSRLKEDTAQATVLSVFFGAGVVLLTRIQHSGMSGQSGLDKFLFGQAASLVISDVQLMSAVAVLLCLMAFLFFKEWKLLCFDSAFGSGLGLPMVRLDSVLMMMIVAAVVIGLQAVGMVLIAALLIIPAAAARFWTERLAAMVVLSAILGGASGALGSIVSALPMTVGLPTGPVIVLSAAFVFTVSVLFAPQRGVLARLWRVWRTREKVSHENLLRDWYEILEKTSSATTSPPPVALKKLNQKRGGHSVGELKQLAKKGLVLEKENGWILTDEGLREAYRVVRSHRLWEMFLMYETALGTVNIDRDADSVEEFLSPEALGQLETMLRKNGLEPKKWERNRALPKPGSAL